MKLLFGNKFTTKNETTNGRLNSQINNNGKIIELFSSHILPLLKLVVKQGYQQC